MKTFFQSNADPVTSNLEPAQLTRRQFLKLLLATSAVLIAGCSREEQIPEPQETPAVTAADDQVTELYGAVQPIPDLPPDPGTLRFFTAHEARTVEAITARILPGTASDPGAREAEVATYIDHMLAYEQGFVQPAYLEGPTVRLYEGEEPPQEAEGSEAIWVAAGEIGRYGYQSPLSPAEVYRMGLEALDAYAQASYGGDFADLDEANQDAIVEALVNDQVDGFEPFGAHQFFQVLRRGTMEGMFSDPIYGGNRDKIGWRLVGFPGSQRAYLPWEIQIEGGLERPIWGLRDLPPFNYSQPRTDLPASPARRLDPRGYENDGRQGDANGH